MSSRRGSFKFFPGPPRRGGYREKKDGEKPEKTIKRAADYTTRIGTGRKKCYSLATTLRHSRGAWPSPRGGRPPWRG